MVSPNRTLGILLLAILPSFGVPTSSSAQASARVRTEENVRKDPNGALLARLQAGTVVGVAGHRDSWTQVDMEGWVWSRSLQRTDRDGFDLVVSAEEGENLRDGPSGEIVGRLARGLLLEELDRQPTWIHVRRRAWMWSASLAEAVPAASPGRPGAGAGAAPSRPAGFAVAGPEGAAILSAPGGDTVGRAVPRAEMEIVAREGSWARVRLEGWTWIPPTDSVPTSASTGSLTPAEARQDPAGSSGRMVEWQLQFISMERAEKVRTDFFEGEPFLLTRYGGSDGPFVYVAVPKERVQEFQGLVPLELLVVTGRVRIGSSSLTGTPIIDLVSVKRVRDP